MKRKKKKQRERVSMEKTSEEMVRWFCQHTISSRKVETKHTQHLEEEEEEEEEEENVTLTFLA